MSCNIGGQFISEKDLSKKVKKPLMISSLSFPLMQRLIDLRERNVYLAQNIHIKYLELVSRGEDAIHNLVTFIFRFKVTNADIKQGMSGAHKLFAFQNAVTIMLNITVVYLNPLSTNPTKCSNTLKQFVGKNNGNRK